MGGFGLQHPAIAPTSTSTAPPAAGGSSREAGNKGGGGTSPRSNASLSPPPLGGGPSPHDRPPPPVGSPGLTLGRGLRGGRGACGLGGRQCHYRSAARLLFARLPHFLSVCPPPPPNNRLTFFDCPLRRIFCC